MSEPCQKTQVSKQKWLNQFSHILISETGGGQLKKFSVNEYEIDQRRHVLEASNLPNYRKTAEREFSVKQNSNQKIKIDQTQFIVDKGLREGSHKN